MRVITFATQKGGSGKSTILASVAVAAEAEGLRTIVLDTDWTSLRGVEGSVKNPSTPGGRHGTQTTPETVYP